MNKAKIYPWIFAVVFGVVFGFLITIALANISLGEVKYESIYGGILGDYYAYCFKPSLYSILFMTIGLGSLAAATIYADRRDDANWLAFGVIILIILSLLVLAAMIPPSSNGEWVKDGWGEKIVNCVIVGTYIATSILIVNIVTIRWDSYKVLIASWSAGPIIGIFVPWNYFNILLIASIGYAIGVPIKEKAGQKAEIKRRAELEREKIRRKEERRRLEYDQKIRGYKSKVEHQLLHHPIPRTK